MKRIALPFVCLIALSCSDANKSIRPIQDPNLTAEQIDSVLNIYKFRYESPILVDSSNYIILPISTELFNRRKMFSSDGYEKADFPRYWNVLFYNQSTGKSTLLTEKKFRISNIWATEKNLNYNDQSSKLLKGKILYKIGHYDFNADNMLNKDDPEFLFISDLDGQNLERVSPFNEDLIYHEVIPKKDQIIISTRRDSDGDKSFTKEDELIWYRSQFKDGIWSTEEMIDSAQRKSIEHLYFKQWLSK